MEKGLFRIIYDAATKTFRLFDSEGRVVCCNPSARKCSQYAFANGADVVRHDYDLKLAE